MSKMNSTNGTPEAAEVQTHANGKNIRELASDVVYANFKKYDYNETEILQIVSGNDPSPIIRETRSDMQNLLQKNPWEYGDFSEDDIRNKISDSYILDLYRKKLTILKREQTRLKSHVISKFTETTFLQKSKDWSENLEILEKWILEQNEPDIVHLLKSEARLQKSLRLTFWSRYGSLEPRKSKAENIFEIAGVNMELLSPSDRLLFQKIESNNAYFGSDDAVQLIDIIRKNPLPQNRKREAIKELLELHFPEWLSMQEAIKLWLIDRNEALEKGKLQLIQWIGNPEYFDHPDAEVRTEREGWAKSMVLDTDMGIYDIADIVTNISALDRFLEKDKHSIPNILEKAIAQKVDSQKSERIAGMMKDDIFDEGLDVTNWHGSFLATIEKMKDSNWYNKIRNIENLAPWSILHYTIKSPEWDEEVYLTIDTINIDTTKVYTTHREWNTSIPIYEKGMQYRDMTRKWWVGPEWSWQPRTKWYSELVSDMRANNLTWEVISRADYDARMDPKNPNALKKIYAEWEEEWIETLQDLRSAVGFTPEAGHILNFKYDWKPTRISIHTIDENRRTITLKDDDEKKEVSYAQFIQFAKSVSATQWEKMQNLDDFQNVFRKMKGFEDVIIKWSQLYKITKKWESKKEELVTHLKNEAGEVLEIQSIGQEGLTFKYGKLKKQDEDDKAKPDGTIAKIRSSNETIGFHQFLNCIDSDNEWFQVYISQKKEEIDVEPHAHLHGYLFTKLLSGFSFNDASKAFELYTHAWEHKLEKNSKFNAAKFADRYFSKLMPESFRGQLKSEMYTVQNEAMEGILKMLEDTMSGKEARLYVRKKILLNKDARFEEVLAGMLYLAKKTGQLYWEELSDLQGSNLWFHQLARTAGYATPADRNALYAKAKSKSPKGEFAVETDVIERTLKSFEWMEMRIPPNIAPKFAGYISEGITGQEEKGAKEVNMLSNIDQMNDYAMSKLNVWEAYKAIACIDRIYGKNGGPVQLNAIPFVLVMSNMPELLGTEFGHRLHKQATGEQIRSSHALAFGNDTKKVAIYRDMVTQAVKEIDRRWGTGTEIMAEYENLQKLKAKVWHESHSKETEEDQKKYINAIYTFWNKHGKKLHPLLHLKDPFIQTQAERGDTNANAYLKRIEWIAGMQRRRDNIEKTDGFWEGNWKYDHTPPMLFKNIAYFTLTSIHPSSHTKEMNSSVYEQWWKPWVIGTLNALRNISNDIFASAEEKRTYQKKMFREYYITIMYYLRDKVDTATYDRLKWMHDVKYMNDLRVQGFDFLKDDFQDHRTVPANISISEDVDKDMNPEYVAEYDKSRMENLFDKFINAKPALSYVQQVVNHTKSASNNWFYENYGT